MDPERFEPEPCQLLVFGTRAIQAKSEEKISFTPDKLGKALLWKIKIRMRF